MMIIILEWASEYYRKAGVQHYQVKSLVFSNLNECMKQKIHEVTMQSLYNTMFWVHMNGQRKIISE